jgi:membrane protein YdbS with pleckstrin-like domain
MTDGSQDEPPRSPKETRRLLAWIWAVWIAAGVFLIVSALTNPIILNLIAVAVWIVGSIVQLFFQLRGRKIGSDQGR